LEGLAAHDDLRSSVAVMFVVVDGTRHLQLQHEGRHVLSQGRLWLPYLRRPRSHRGPSTRNYLRAVLSPLGSSSNPRARARSVMPSPRVPMPTVPALSASPPPPLPSSRAGQPSGYKKARGASSWPSCSLYVAVCDERRTAPSLPQCQSESRARL
jgi:hypothetical protein